MSGPNAEEASRTEGPAAWSPGKLALFLALVALLALLPWTVRNWPTQDGPNHLAVAHIFMHYGDVGAPFPAYVIAEDGMLRPSTLYYGALSLLGAHVGLRVAEKLLVTLTIVALPLSVLLFLRRLAPERTMGAFLVLPLVTGWALAMGFVSYLLALTCGYAVLALAWDGPSAPNARAGWGRWALAASALVVCAWLHPVVSACTGFALLLLEWPMLRDPRTWRRVLVVAGPAAAFVVVSYVAATGGPVVGAPETKWETLSAVLPGAVEYHIAYSAWELAPRGFAVLLLFGLAARTIRSTPLSGTSSLSAVARVVVTFLILYLVMPKVLADWYYCSARFLLLATFLLPALADIPDRLSRWVPWLGTALVLCVIASELPQLLRLSRQMDDVIEVGAELPRGAKLIPMDFMDRGWGTIDKPQPLAHAWARLVETRDVVAADLFAAGKPRMGGDHFRMLSFRPQVLDVATGTLPWPSSEGVHALARQCQDRTSESCRIALSRRRESLAAVIDRYQYVLLLSPPDYVREALAEHLTFRKEVGVAWLYEAAGRPAGGRAPGGALEGGPARSP